MESSKPSAAAAAAALAQAEQSRDSLARGVELPPAFHVAIGTATAIQIATTAVGAAEQTGTGFAVLVGGLLVFLAVAVQQLRAFRRRNGVRLGGLASRVVLGTSTDASLAYAAALAAAVWAAFESAWWLVVLTAVAGGAGYALSGVRWMRTYREDPVRHGRGESALVLALLAVPSVAAGFLLVVNR